MIMSMDNLYYECAEVIRQAIDKEKNVRSAVYGSNFKNKKQLMRLSCEALKNRKYFDRILSYGRLRSLLKEPEYKPFSIIYVLLYEFLFGNGLRRCSKKLSGPIFALQDIILEQGEKLKTSPAFILTTNLEKLELAFPVYGRINTIKCTSEKAFKALSATGWVLRQMPEMDSFSLYRNSIANMKENEIFCDPHISNLLIFPPGTDLHDHSMVRQGCLILQDKASCLSSFLLNPKTECEVLDVCAAPGIKTSHLAALMENRGRIWAMDKAPDRVDTMRFILERAGVTNVSLDCGDCLCLDMNDEKFLNVKYALVDPPCSGSGMVKRLDPFIDRANDCSQSRLSALSNLQAMILKHVLKLPNLKRVVYSTCSISLEENEAVIQEILNDESIGKKYKLATVLPEWEVRGSDDFPFGKKCLRAAPEDTLTNGFFIAVLKRRKQRMTKDILQRKSGIPLQ